MKLSIITAGATFLAAFAQFCSAGPSLRGKDPDGQDPGPIQVVQGGDRPVPDEAPRARELNTNACVNLRDGEHCGYCRDSNNNYYDRIRFLFVPDPDTCLSRCPNTASDKYVGNEYIPSLGICYCRYGDGYIHPAHCPAGASCFVHYSGVGPVASGNGNRLAVCRTRLNSNAALDWAQDATTDTDVNFFIDWAANVWEGTVPSDLVVADPVELVDYAAGFREDFSYMFAYSQWTSVGPAAIPDISGWNVENGRDFEFMFWQTGMYIVQRRFDQDLSGWRITVDDEDGVYMMFLQGGMSSIDHCPCIRLVRWELVEYEQQWGPGTRVATRYEANGYEDWERWCPGMFPVHDWRINDPSCNN